MKTPREIISERHAAMDAKLDALREEVVAQHVSAPKSVAETKRQRNFSPAFAAQKFWEELILPCRKFWIGVAAVWMGILLVNLVTSESASAPRMASAKTVPASPQIMAALKEQRLWVAQMLEPITPPVPKSGTSGPRSERRVELVIG